MGDDDATIDDDETASAAARVACPTCEGTGQQLPADGRPCVMCAGSGLVRADVAESIVESEGMEAGPGTPSGQDPPAVNSPSSRNPT